MGIFGVSRHVAVVMNSYNEEPTLLTSAIHSVLNQKGVRIQLILSTVKGDPSIETAKQYGCIDIVTSRKPGIYAQLNAGIEAVKDEGSWFFYASSNDVMQPTKSIDEINLCISHNKKVCYSSYRRMDAKGKLGKQMKFHAYSYQKHLEGNFVNDCAMMSRGILELCKPFRAQFENSTFWDFWLRVYEEEGNVFVYNPKVAWLYRQLPTSAHLKRKRDPVAKRKNTAERIAMLAAHRRR